MIILYTKSNVLLNYNAFEIKYYFFFCILWIDYNLNSLFKEKVVKPIFLLKNSFETLNE